MNNNKKTILLVGGHLSPALAVIEALQKTGGWYIEWVGRKTAMEGKEIMSLEYSVIPSLGIPFHEIETGRIQRRLTREFFTSIAKIPIGFFQSFTLIQKLRPSVVLAFGGYVSFPVVIAAWLQRIPIVIHEQTNAAGLANIAASRFARKVAISFESTRESFPADNVVLTGNPVRSSIFSLQWKPTRTNGKRLIYITGGNQGSHALNTVVKKILAELLKNFRVIHQTGFLDYGYFNSLQKNTLKKGYQSFALIDPQIVEKIFTQSSLVISRSGANTVSELAVMGIPSILIPLPWSGYGEQEKNARILAETGLAKMILQENLTPELLLEVVHELTNQMPSPVIRQKARALIPHDAAEKIVSLLEKTAT